MVRPALVPVPSATIVIIWHQCAWASSSRAAPTQEDPTLSLGENAVLSRRNAMLNILSAAVLPAAQSLAQTAPSGADPVTVLQVQRRSIEVKGKPASILAVRQPDGTPGLVTAVGRQFRVRLENKLNVPTLMHWHGLTPPWQQDGVPGISGPPIPPGGSADYDFPLRFGGTFWMHSHQGLQEQELLAAPLIIHDERDRPDQQEVVVMLADFSFTPPEKIFENLRKGGSMAGMPAPAAGKPKAMGAMAMPAKPVAAKMAPMSRSNFRPRSERCEIRRLPSQ